MSHLFSKSGQKPLIDEIYSVRWVWIHLKTASQKAISFMFSSSNEENIKMMTQKNIDNNHIDENCEFIIVLSTS